MLINKFKKALKEKRLFLTLKNKITPYITGLLIIFFKKKSKIINIHIDNLSTVEKKDKELHERIFHSFKLMKKIKKIVIKFINRHPYGRTTLIMIIMN